MWKEQFLNLTKGTHTLKSAMKTQKQLEKQETKTKTKKCNSEISNPVRK